jgi:translation initiation factor 5
VFVENVLLIFLYKLIVEEAVAAFKTWCDEHSATAGTQAIVDKVRSLQAMSSLRSADRYVILLGGLFSDQAVVNSEVTKNKEIFATMLTTPIHQRQLLAAIEWFCGTRCRQLQKYFPVFLKQLYDEDLVDEDVFFQWNLDPTPNDYSVSDEIISAAVLVQLKQSAKPFITWLDEAEEEDDSEEDDDNV